MFSRARAFATVSAVALLSTLITPAASASGRTTWYAVNVGGPASGSFAADTARDPSPYLTSTSSIQSTSRTLGRHGVPSDVPMKALQSAREGGSKLVYEFPSPNATVEVELYFAELETARQRSGARVMHVFIEGRKMVHNLDSVRQGGTWTAVRRAKTVTVRDGSLTVEIRRASGDGARLNAIEVVGPTSKKPNGAAAPAPAPQPDPEPAPEPQDDPAPPPADDGRDDAPVQAPAVNGVGGDARDAGTRSSTPSANGAIRITPGQDAAAIVDKARAGSTFLFTRGVHRIDELIPENGDRFIGESGAVLSGARVLSGWQKSGSYWFVDGQTQQGWVSPNLALAENGNPAHLRPEQLWVGSTLLEPVTSKSMLRAGRWWFDYRANKIWLGQNPGSQRIETSVTPYAINGKGAARVTVENLVVERFATRSSHGAIHGLNSEDWVVRRVEVRDNHGGGITVGPGMLIDHAHVHHNGQVGIVGRGERTDGKRLSTRQPVVVRAARVHDNGILDYKWTFEKGGTKIKKTGSNGSLFEDSWVYGNHGPGVWYDSFAKNVTIRDTLVERNERHGIFYELSHGPALITGNVSRDNGVGANPASSGTQIHVSNSEDVTVRANVVQGGERGIMVRTAGNRRPLTANVEIAYNEITTTKGFSGMSITGVSDNYWTNREVVFHHNTWDLPSRTGRFFKWSDRRMTFDDWSKTQNGTGARYR